MARLPYTFRGAPRFVVDSEGVVTDQREAFIRGVTALFEQNLTEKIAPSSQAAYEDPVFEFTPPDTLPEGWSYGPPPPYETKRYYTYTDFVTVDDSPTFDQKALDNLISDRLKAQREARERLIFEEQHYNGNPDCLLGVEGCTCGLSRERDER